LGWLRSLDLSLPSLPEVAESDHSDSRAGHPQPALQPGLASRRHAPSAELSRPRAGARPDQLRRRLDLAKSCHSQLPEPEFSNVSNESNSTDCRPDFLLQFRLVGSRTQFLHPLEQGGALSLDIGVNCDLTAAHGACRPPPSGRVDLRRQLQRPLPSPTSTGR
jgi:hypothetical protein